MISGHSSQPPKSVMKARKRVKLSQLPKSKLFVESEDDKDPIVQPISRGVPEVVLPQRSTIVVRKPQLPQLLVPPRSNHLGLLCCPEVTKSPISRQEARATSGSRLEVKESSDDTSSASDGDLPANTTFDITIPGPVKQLLLLLCQGELALCDSFGQEVQLSPACLASAAPPRRSNATLHLWDPHPDGPEGSLPPAGCVPRHLPLLHLMLRLPPSQGPKLIINLSHGRSKTITIKKTPAPAPAPAPSSSVAVPRAALDVPMPDLHSMAITIQNGAARIALLEARVQEQDTKIDTLQCLHESLRHMVVDQHPSFSLPDTPADATILLDQGSPPLMEPTPLTPEDGSAMVGPMVEPTQVQSEGPQSFGKIVLLDEPGNLLPESSGNIVVPNKPGNLLPEYDSSDKEMDVEGKVDLPGEEVEMAT
ncbi:uncharacterized protein F5147DRAFT_780055 [Suillus discolor]|uniref:Uncharacterized protein n=1 Tax=Suillus discolor TaxID=1912936 RepID=A0A9P7EVW0_9AGAM|nr:uncharacterized protein F5147DRAFT_780055 [Suillus discolor]KAG2091175.1 hypothetical protein F5147DRAFT_780055 [Suillus discolor]